MIPNPKMEAQDAFAEFVQRWFRLLAEARLDEACAQLDEPNSYGLKWNSEQILESLRAYNQAAKATDPSLAVGRAVSNCGDFDDGSGHWFDHAVPLNGEWSDLTAQFEFKRRPDGFAVILHDLHVL
jgi:hypothetical protein